MFPIILGIMMPTDFHMFQRGRLKHQPEMIPRYPAFTQRADPQKTEVGNWVRWGLFSCHKQPMWLRQRAGHHCCRPHGRLGSRRSLYAEG